MPIEKSLTAYRIRKQNCAQSIYTGFQELLDVHQRVIDDARKLGGGKAEGGLCGALHAAIDLSRCPETEEELKSNFEKLAGSQNCREIRSKKLMSCAQCVELAATVLERHVHQNRE